MDEREQTAGKPLSSAEKSGLDKKKAISKAASYFSDDDSLFEFEGFEIEELAKDIDELTKKEENNTSLSSNTGSNNVENIETNEKNVSGIDSSNSGNKDKSDETASFGNEIELENNKDTAAFDENKTENSKNNTVSELVEASQSKNETVFEETVSSFSQKSTAIDEKETSYNEIVSDLTDDEKDSITNDSELNTNATKESELNTNATKESELNISITEESGLRLNSGLKVGENSESSEDDGYGSGLLNEAEDNEVASSQYTDVEKNKNIDILFDKLKNNVISSNEAAVHASGKNETHTENYTDEILSYGLERNTVNVEGQISFEGTKSEFSEITEKGDADESHSQLSEYDTKTNKEFADTLYDEEDLDNEIWDRAGKEEWQARESFISYCKSLTLPPVSAGASPSTESENVKLKATSSGYRYAESERIPVFSDGMYGGVDKAGYTERERRYCENRKTKREIALREKTRSLHRAVMYTALILFTVFLLEILNLFISGQTVLFASLEIGLTLLAAAFVWKGLCDGLKCAVKGVFVPELLAFLTVILSLAYGFVTVFTPQPEGSAVLIGLPGVCATFLTAIYLSLMSKREKKVFDITADYGNYCTEVRLSSFKGSPEEIAYGEYVGESCTLYKTNRISRADRGYNIQPVKDECFGLIKILVICIICAAIASGIAFGFIKRDVYFGLFSAYMLVCLSCPLSVFLSLSLPRHITAETIAEDGAAITDFDDESDEFDENVIMISEEELFPPEKIRILDTYWTNSHLLETHLSKAAAAFRKTGGLLSGLFSGIDLNPGNFKDVVITDISDGGITVKVDDSLVRAGTDAYLEKHGIEIERYPDIPQKDTRVLYIANNGEFFSRIAIQFNPDERLCRKMSELRQSDTLFSLKTCNPCVDCALVFYTTGLEPELLRVIKYMVEDNVCKTDTDREGILVSRTGAYGLFSALLGYKRQKKLVLLGCRLAALSGLIGLASALAVSLVGVKLSFISFLILGFHAIMSGAAVLIGLSGKNQSRKNGKI